MGQYYRPITQRNKTIKVYNRNVVYNGTPEYTLAKIMEHSWWKNDAVNAVCKDIYQHKTPTRLIWMGDYADTFLESFNFPDWNGLKQEQLLELMKKTWNCEGDNVNPPEFSLDGKYIVNHTKKCYLDCNEYYENSKMYYYDDIWCIHPLPILTCIGNGQGGGDYTCPTDDSSFEYVGTWAWDKLTIEDTAPDYLKINIRFKERGWEE